MSDDEILDLLTREESCAEVHVLVRELRVFLDVGHEHFRPSVGVRIWKGGPHADLPYHFSLSHYVHTPVQDGQYVPSTPMASTEEATIHEAMRAMASFLRDAIEQGHEPEDGWLVVNEDY